MKVLPYIYRILFLFIIVFPATIFAPPHITYPDEVSMVKVLGELIQKQPHYQLFIAESFNGLYIWDFFRGNSHLNQIDFVSKFPENEAFQLEKEIYKPYMDSEIPKSMMAYSTIELPKSDKFIIKPNVPIRIPDGFPYRAYLWVHSNKYHLNLKVIVSNPKTGNFTIDFGSLRFNGWRRLEGAIHLPYKDKRLIESRQNANYSIDSILIQSNHNQEKGAFTIYFDNLAILLDTHYLQYPGSEIRDDWKN